MNFAEAIATNPPRLVVLYQRTPNGEEFQWNVVGGIPILNLVGHIIEAQTKLVTDWHMQECENPHPALVMTWNAESRSMAFFKHPDIPGASLAGMLETIKFTLVAGRLGQAAAAQRVNILGPDGKLANGYRIGG